MNGIQCDNDNYVGGVSYNGHSLKKTYYCYDSKLKVHILKYHGSGKLNNDLIWAW